MSGTMGIEPEPMSSRTEDHDMTPSAAWSPRAVALDIHYFRGSGDEVLFLLMWMLGAISIFAAFYCCWDKAVRKRMRVPSTLVSDTDDPSFTTAPAATRVRPTDSPPEYSRYPPQVRQADYSEEPPPPYSVVVESQQMYLHTQNPLEVDIQQPYFTTPPIGVHQINSAR